MNYSQRPGLVEPGVRNFLDHALHKSWMYRMQWNYFAWNFLIGTVFIVGIGCYLLYKYKTRPPLYEIERREQEKYQQTLLEIKRRQLEKIREHQGVITGQPNWRNEFEYIARSMQPATVQPSATVLPAY